MRIAIVNDDIPTLRVLEHVLRQRTSHAIAWTAQDGRQAIELCAADTPDVLLLDIVMPNVNGVEAARQIMKTTPCAILLVTASVQGNAAMVFDALGAGALDVVTTPCLAPAAGHATIDAFLSKIDMVGKLVRQVEGTTVIAPPPPAPLLAIGASTGGPTAVKTILSRLPMDLHAAVVVVQHVDEQFTAGLANWLGEQIALPVRLASDGTEPSPGAVLLAGHNDHLVLRADGTLGYTPHPNDCPYRPSVDVFFTSVAAHFSGPVIGVLLTGMGRDGAQGMLELRQKRHHTIAQDEASSTVYGMPKAAARSGAAVEILHLNDIAGRLIQLVARGARA